jgi:hypothetical protein
MTAVLTVLENRFELIKGSNFLKYAENSTSAMPQDGSMTSDGEDQPGGVSTVQEHASGSEQVEAGGGGSEQAEAGDGGGEQAAAGDGHASLLLGRVRPEPDDEDEAQVRFDVYISLSMHAKI